MNALYTLFLYIASLLKEDIKRVSYSINTTDKRRGYFK